MNLPKLATLRTSFVENVRQQSQTAVASIKKGAEKLAAGTEAVEATIASHTKESVAVALAVATVTSGLVHGLEAPKPADFQNFSDPFTNCAPLPAPTRDVVSGTLQDGRSFKVALDQAAAAHGTPEATSLACVVEQTANAEGAAAIKFLNSPEGKSANSETKAAARNTLREYRVSAAEADLQLVKEASDLSLREKDLQSAAQGITSQEGTGNWDHVGSQYVSLLKQEASASSVSTDAAKKRAEEDLKFVRFGINNPEKNPNFVAGGASEAERQGSDVEAKLGTNTPERTQSLKEATTKLLSDTQRALARQATPLWSEDHPTENPPAAALTAVDTGLPAGKTLAQLGAPLEVAYRAQPGVAAKHSAEIQRDAIGPVFARELPGGAPSDAMKAKAMQMWAAGASNADIGNALVPMIHDTAAWRESIVAAHINDYYNQKNNWDCGPSSATNVFDLLGIAPGDDGLAAKFIDAFGTNPDIGTPGGVDYMAPIMKDIAARDYGVTLNGYLGEATDFNAVRDALNNGYVLMVNGTVVGTPDSGHFIAIKKINPDGTLMMADPWMPEFANSTITFDQLAQFTNNPSHHSQFYAFSRS